MTVIVDGLAASIASVIAMAADRLILAPKATMMIDDGWTFVAPSAQPTIPPMTLAKAIKSQAFCLLERSTALVLEQRARERAPHMDLDTRALAIMGRYTGDAPIISVGRIRVTVTKLRADDEEAPPPLTTPEEVRTELLKRFAPADVRLFMQRHFGV